MAAGRHDLGREAGGAEIVGHPLRCALHLLVVLGPRTHARNAQKIEQLVVDATVVVVEVTREIAGECGRHAESEVWEERLQPGSSRQARAHCKRRYRASSVAWPAAAPSIEHPHAAPRAHHGAAPERDDLAQRDRVEVRPECGDYRVVAGKRVETEHENEPVTGPRALRELRPEVVLVGAAVHVDGEGFGMIVQVERELRRLLIPLAADPRARRYWWARTVRAARHRRAWRARPIRTPRPWGRARRRAGTKGTIACA